MAKQYIYGAVKTRAVAAIGPIPIATPKRLKIAASHTKQNTEIISNRYKITTPSNAICLAKKNVPRTSGPPPAAFRSRSGDGSEPYGCRDVDSGGIDRTAIVAAGFSSARFFPHRTRAHRMSRLRFVRAGDSKSQTDVARTAESITNHHFSNRETKLLEIVVNRSKQTTEDISNRNQIATLRTLSNRSYSPGNFLPPIDSLAPRTCLFVQHIHLGTLAAPSPPFPFQCR